MLEENDISSCPCGSGKPYSDCCDVYISERKHAPTPQALMRSRYSAYTQANIDYIQQTMAGKAAEGFDAAVAKTWAENCQWLGLTVLAEAIDPSDPNKATVEFVARFQYANKSTECMHEVSQFRRLHDQWFYTDGKRGDIKRNDPCFCQSGRKFKKCCGA